MDVWRQRHRSRLAEQPGHVAAIGEPHGPAAVREALPDLHARRPGSDLHDRARTYPAARPHQRFPRPALTRAQQQDLHTTAGHDPATAKPRRNHARVVQDQHVAGVQILADVAKDAVGEAPGGAVHNQQPGSVARRGRLLGDELGWQRVVEVGQPHQGRGPTVTPV